MGRHASNKSARQGLASDRYLQLCPLISCPSGDGHYRGTPQSPQTGDLRVGFEVIEPTTVSVIGKQVEDGTEVARMPKGARVRLNLGRVDAGTMFAKTLDTNAAVIWA
ncbi:TMEM43 family protein [Thiorhodococcus fuscus]|uniref:TMEM43 family protein n=1 Tax=Thiorhodococcus fuscus TaxID=527200 RepID=A0ABW4YDQ0_9GAMM